MKLSILKIQFIIQDEGCIVRNRNVNSIYNIENIDIRYTKPYTAIINTSTFSESGNKSISIDLDNVFETYILNCTIYNSYIAVRLGKGTDDFNCTNCRINWVGVAFDCTDPGFHANHNFIGLEVERYFLSIIHGYGTIRCINPHFELNSNSSMEINKLENVSITNIKDNIITLSESADKYYNKFMILYLKRNNVYYFYYITKIQDNQITVDRNVYSTDTDYTLCRQISKSFVIYSNLFVFGGGINATKYNYQAFVFGSSYIILGDYSQWDKGVIYVPRKTAPYARSINNSVYITYDSSEVVPNIDKTPSYLYDNSNGTEWKFDALKAFTAFSPRAIEACYVEFNKTLYLVKDLYNKNITNSFLQEIFPQLTQPYYAKVTLTVLSLIEQDVIINLVVNKGGGSPDNNKINFKLKKGFNKIEFPCIDFKETYKSLHLSSNSNVYLYSGRVKALKIPIDGTSNQRPTLDADNKGFKYFNIETKVEEVWNGKEWRYNVTLPLDKNNKGTTVQRPVLTADDESFEYYDSTLKKKILWNGTAWVNLDGTELAQ